MYVGQKDDIIEEKRHLYYFCSELLFLCRGNYFKTININELCDLPNNTTFIIV